MVIQSKIKAVDQSLLPKGIFIFEAMKFLVLEENEATEDTNHSYFCKAGISCDEEVAAQDHCVKYTRIRV